MSAKRVPADMPRSQAGFVAWKADEPWRPQELRAFRLLASLSDSELEFIASKLSLETAFLGQIGARTTVEEVRFNLVLSGAYRVVALSTEGAPVTLRPIGPGEYFGEMGILANKAPGNWAAVADKPGDVLYMSRGDFREVLDRVPDLRTALLYAIATQAAKWAERIFELATLSPRARLLAELLRLADFHGLTGKQGELRSAPTHDTLAAEIGITREAVSRHMNLLRKDGLISSGRREITFTDLPRLRALVNGEVD